MHRSSTGPLMFEVGVRIGRGGMSALSPFYPQLRTLVGAAGTAASCQEATYAPQQTAPLFDHLVGEGESRRTGTVANRPLPALRTLT